MDQAVTPKDISSLAQAIHFTVEYVGYDLLPAVPGWSWYDALRKYDPDLADRHKEQYERHVERRCLASD